MVTPKPNPRNLPSPDPWSHISPREELVARTQLMGGEMERWRVQAEATARAVVDAKNEVILRKKDLDHTKDKMDSLVEKLYLSREKVKQPKR